MVSLFVIVVGCVELELEKGFLLELIKEEG